MEKILGYKCEVFVVFDYAEVVLLLAYNEINIKDF